MRCVLTLLNTQLLLPVRIAASIALAGPFARMTIEPVKRLARRWKR